MSWTGRLNPEKDAFAEIEYLRSNGVPMAVLRKNHSNGYTYKQQAYMHKLIRQKLK